MYVEREWMAVVLRNLQDPFSLQINFVTSPCFEIHSSVMRHNTVIEDANYHSWVTEAWGQVDLGDFLRLRKDRQSL